MREPGAFMRELVLTITIILGVGGGVTDAQAQSAEQLNEAKQLLGVMRFSQRNEAARDLPGDTSKAPAFRKAYRDIQDKYLPPAELERMAIAEYASAFTADELRALRTFYESPVGQRLLDEQPKIAAKVAAHVSKVMEAHRSELVNAALRPPE